MLKTNFSWIALFAFGLTACVPPVAQIIAPKALVIAGPPVVAPPVAIAVAVPVGNPVVAAVPSPDANLPAAIASLPAAAAASPVSAAAVPVKVPKGAKIEKAAAPHDDGLRMPNMLELPGERELRSSGSRTPRTGVDSGAVISRPPVAESPSPAKPAAAQR